LVTVSDSAAADITRVTGIPEGRIQVAYESLNPEFKKPTKPAVTKALKEHRLNRPYVIYLGGFDYRKNVRRLVAGFGESGLGETHDLVIAGAEDVPAGALFADYHRLATLLAQAGIQSKSRLIGKVTEADKAALLTGADALCYPSLAEGFGLPILEALACGTPVAASRLPVTKELFSGAINYFDPMNESDLAAVLKETVGVRPKAVQKRARQIVKDFNWPDTAARTAAVYRAASGHL
jgi:glycosyltransferase involved in cell wall biosynthesis